MKPSRSGQGTLIGAAPAASGCQIGAFYAPCASRGTSRRADACTTSPKSSPAAGGWVVIVLVAILAAARLGNDPSRPPSHGAARLFFPVPFVPVNKASKVHSSRAVASSCSTATAARRMTCSDCSRLRSTVSITRGLQQEWADWSLACAARSAWAPSSTSTASLVEFVALGAAALAPCPLPRTVQRPRPSPTVFSAHRRSTTRAPVLNLACGRNRANPPPLPRL